MENRFAVHILLQMLHPEGRLELDPTHGAEWREVVDVALAQGIGPLLLHNLQNRGWEERVEQESLRRLRERWLHASLSNTKRLLELAAVLRALHNEGIEVIVLKGAHLAEHFYDHIGLRPMGDLDLLVRKEDLQRVGTVLMSMGYLHQPPSLKRNSTPQEHHLEPFHKTGESPIEVHWALPLLAATKLTDEFWERSRWVMFGDQSARVLCDEDLLLHVAVHASLHHRFDVGLRGLCDIALIVRQKGRMIDWKVLQRIADGAGVLTALYVMIRLSKELLGAPVSNEHLGDLLPHFDDVELIEWAMEQILAQEHTLTDPSSMSPRLARFMTASLTTKMRSVLDVLFPSVEDLARLYRVPFPSLRVWAYYPRRWKDVIVHRRGAFVRAFRGEPETMLHARMYRRLTNDPQT